MGTRLMAYVHQEYVATIETMSEASKQIKAYSCIALYASRDGDMQYESTNFPAPYVTIQPLQPETESRL